MLAKVGKFYLRAILLIILLTVCAFIYTRWIEPSMLIATKFTKKIPPEVKESRIVFFSDTHFGKHYNQKNLAKIVRKINTQKPDAVIFGGDFFDNYARDHEIIDLAYLKSELSKIEASSAKYLVLGNHDYGGGASRFYIDLMRESGFSLLRDTSEYNEDLKINFIGFDDALLGKTDPSVYDIKNEKFNVVVLHEPDTSNFIDMKQDGLMLSGHSHGGQVSIPFYKKMLPPGATEYVKGRYDNCGPNQNFTLVVSSGVGMTVVPHRFLNIPEIITVTLKH